MKKGSRYRSACRVEYAATHAHVPQKKKPAQSNAATQNTNRRPRFQHAFINGDLDPGLQLPAVFFVSPNDAAGVQCRELPSSHSGKTWQSAIGVAGISTIMKRTDSRSAVANKQTNKQTNSVSSAHWNTSRNTALSLKARMIAAVVCESAWRS